MIYNSHLEGNPFEWPGGPVGILLVHGFTATVAEVRPLARRLHQAGYTVAGPLLPGHFTHPRDLNRVHWQDWTAAVELAYCQLQERCERIIVGGESTGGLLSMYLALSHPEITALLLYAPALKLALRSIDKLRMRLVAPFVPWVDKQNLDSNDLWQGYPVNPLKGALQLLALQDQVQPRLKEIHQPVMIVQGRLDTTVHPSVPDMIASGVSSQIVEKIWFERSAHCVILDQELDQVTEATLNFIHRVIG